MHNSQNRKRAVVSAERLWSLQLDDQQSVIDKEAVHSVNSIFGGNGRVVADKPKALAELDSLVHRNLFAAFPTFVFHNSAK